MSKRLFFALWPDDAVRRQIVERTAGLVTASRGRATPPANLHVTVAFLRSVEIALIPAICAAVGALRVPEFNLTLERVGHWYRSRILWLGPPPDSRGAAAASLAGAIWQALVPLGFTPERRRFHPHVTLARKTGPVAAARIEAVHWRVREFVLVESLTGQRRASYRIVAAFPLEGA